jgi:signal transduction histidine kinase
MTTEGIGTGAVLGSGPMNASPSPAPAPVPQHRRHPLLSILISPVQPSTWAAFASVIIGFALAILAFSVVTTLFSTGAGLLIVIVGIPILGLGIEAARLTARAERWRMTLTDGRPLVARPYRPLDPNPTAPLESRIRAWAEAEFLDSSRWFDVIYVAIFLPLAVIEFTIMVTLWATAVAFVLTPLALAWARSFPDRIHFWSGPFTPEGATAILFLFGLVLLPVSAYATRGMIALHRAVVEGLLCINPSEALQRDNARLRGSRAAAVELEASELRRIERDLHDGAQQRLVMLAIDLTLAEDKVDTDPAAARTLISGARDQARQALGEIREVVRGTAPAILMDRGLVAALGAVAGRSAIATYIDSALAPNERLPHAVERAAYYVVSEALTNVAKHAGATRCDVTIRREPHRLGVWVRDDGHGGAAIVQGGGLAGLKDRAEALDGKLLLDSPAGGPTTIYVELPLTAW